MSNTIPTGGPIRPSVLSPTIELVLGTAIASAATITVVTGVHHVTGSATITTINPPYTGFTGEINLISDAGFTLGTGGNLGVTAPILVAIGTMVTLFWDSTKWYPIGASSSGNWVNVKDFGAKGDGITNDTAAIQAAINSLINKGGTVFFPAGTYMVSSTISLMDTSTNSYANIVLEGVGYMSCIKASQTIGLAGGATTSVISLGGFNLPYQQLGVGFRKLRVSGFDETTRNGGGPSPLISVFRSDGFFAESCYIDTHPTEGWYFNNYTDTRNVRMTGCYATRTGGWSTATSDVRAAYNLNASNVTFIGNRSFQVGQAIESVGNNQRIVGNSFEYSGYNSGASLFATLSIASTEDQQATIIADNYIKFGGTGILISNATAATGEMIVANNIIESCDSGINVPSAGIPFFVHDNYIYDTATNLAQGTAIRSGSGGSSTVPAVIKNNLIQRGPTGQWAYAVQINDVTAPTIVRNNEVIGNGSGGATTTVTFYNLQSGNSTVQFIDNLIQGETVAGHIRYQWRGVQYSQATFSGIDNGTVLSTVRPSVVRHTAAPTTGTWSVGDVVVNATPSASGIDKWICTTAGTPGTWSPIYISFGPLVVGAALASGATIAPSSPIHHVTGTTTIATITAPSNFAQSGYGGRVTLVFDGVAPWSAAGNIAVAGTPTTAGTSVDFTYDNATSKWYPSRLA